MNKKPVMHLLSGGLDSTVLLCDLLNQNCNVHCVLFHYGQAHANRELTVARQFLDRENFHNGKAKLLELWIEGFKNPQQEFLLVE